MQETEHKSFESPDETRRFPNGEAEILTVQNAQIGRLILQPGWRWSNDVKPLAKTASCEAPHFQYHVSGRLKVVMDDGTEVEAGPGDITSLPPGHDGWVVGDEPAVVIDWFGANWLWGTCAGVGTVAGLGYWVLMRRLPDEEPAPGSAASPAKPGVSAA